MQQLIERKKYMQTLRNLKDQNIIKVITGVRRCGKQFAEYYRFIIPKPPNLSNSGSLATCITEGAVLDGFNPVYNGIRKLNVADWLLSGQ